MNYRHIYHAGSFSDVIKHLVLMVLLKALQRKDTPFCFLDTHAGIGLYELQSEQALKKEEYKNGIGQLFSLDQKTMPPIIQEYVSIVQKYNVDNKLHFYPGSPVIAEELLRTQDHMILCELHQEDYQSLKENFSNAKNVAIHHTDAYLAIKAFVPSKLKRGLVLIDPPFEVTHEFELIFSALQKALKHWRSGHFMVWYPIKNNAAVQAFYRDIKSLNTDHLMIHFSLNHPAEEGKLSACGIVLINPPWQVKENVETMLPYLATALSAEWEFCNCSASF